MAANDIKLVSISSKGMVELVVYITDDLGTIRMAGRMGPKEAKWFVDDFVRKAKDFSTGG